MSLKNIRVTSAASFKKKLKTLELALHHAGTHPRYQLYFVREGKITYTLEGKPIVLDTMRKVLNVPKDSIPVKIGHLVIDYFGKVKAVYAFARPGDAHGAQYFGSATDYYNELLDYAHMRFMVPGFQYSTICVAPRDQYFTIPKMDRPSEWTNYPWSIRSCQISDANLLVYVYRPTPPAMASGAVNTVHFNMYSQHRGTKTKLEPITLYLAAQTSVAGNYRHLVLHPVRESEDLPGTLNWLLNDAFFIVGLRLPSTEAKKA
jgi:hypothetical protein